MPLIFDQKPNPENVVYNGIPVDRVIWDGILVWEKAPTEQTVQPDILTPNANDITYNSVIWYIRNDDNQAARVYSKLSTDASYTSVASVAPGANAQFSRIGLLDKHAYTIQAYAIVDAKLQSDFAIEEQFTTDPIYYSVKWYDGYDAAPYFTQTIEKGNTVNAFAAPPVPPELGVGYEFNYWQVNSSQATFPYTINANTNFIAVWKQVSYTITWKNWNNSTLKTQSVGSGYYLTTSDQPAATRTGYTFNGWSPTLPLYVYENKTLTAQFTVNSYYIRWYDYEGAPLKSILKNYGTTVESTDYPANPTYGCYTFTGWSQSAPFTVPANDVNITSNWSANAYTIRWLNWDGSVLKTQTKYCGDSVTSSDAPTNPSRTGYTFTEWSVTLPFTVSANKDITAQFDVNSYVCYWFYGDETYTTRTYNYGTNISSAAIDPGTVGCKYFTEWSPSLPHTVTASTSFVPQYSYYNYTVTWVDGWGNTLKTKSYQCGATCASGDYPANPANSTCHTFASWDKASGFVVYQNWTITATWTLNYFNVNWYDFDGANIRTRSKCCGCEVTSADYPSNPAAPSCRTWNGWSKTAPFYVSGTTNIYPNTPGYTTPGVPSSMTGTSPSNNRLNLSWGTGSCASSYTYEYKLTTSSTWTTASTTGTSKTGIVVGAGYYDIRVKAVNGTASSTYKDGADVRVYGVVY